MPDTHAVRSHRSEIDFGNLDGLAGQWIGSNGVNLIAVPNQEMGFKLLVEPYTESLVVTKIQATTPNRGLHSIESIPTLQYATTVGDAVTGSLMHVEGGFWELCDPALNDNFDIFRLASVPHGNAVEAMGTSSVVQGPPVIDTTLSSKPTGDVPHSFGYMDPYLSSPYAAFAKSPNQTLVDYLSKQESQGINVIETVTLNVSTRNKGGIANIASIQANAVARQLDATFWIETLQNADGQVYKQLQYSQTVLIDFPVRGNTGSETVTWPHISVNTLTLIS